MFESFAVRGIVGPYSERVVTRVTPGPITTGSRQVTVIVELLPDTERKTMARAEQQLRVRVGVRHGGGLFRCSTRSRNGRRTIR